MRKCRLRTTALLVGLALSTGVMTAASTAAATPGLTCGSTLTVDTTLTRNLHCHGDGLTLARGVSLDLGGHQLNGDGTGRAVVVLGNADATVRHGRIGHWAAGVVVLGQRSGADGPVLALDLLRISHAPLSVDEASLTLTDSTVDRSNISVTNGYVSVVRSRLDRSDVDDVGVLQLDHSRLTRSAIDAGGTVYLTDSVLDGHGRDVAPLTCGDGEHTFLRSTVKRFGRPMVALESCNATVTDSTFSHNNHGVFVSPSGPSSRDGQILTVGTSEFDHDDTAIKGRGFVVDGSIFTRNRVGIQLDGVANVYGSTFRRNSRDGLYAVDGSTPVLKANLAVRNHRYGLYAPGSIDEGGNRAHDNGKADCVGVTCTS